MQNNNLDSNHKDEINLREILILLLEAKKIIFIVTLFFTLIAASYSYSLKTKYESSATIKIGHINNEFEKVILNKVNSNNYGIKSKLIDSGTLFLSTHPQSSAEEAEVLLLKAIDYAIETSNNDINKRIISNQNEKLEKLNELITNQNNRKEILKKDIEFDEKEVEFFLIEINRLSNMEDTSLVVGLISNLIIRKNYANLKIYRTKYAISSVEETKLDLQESYKNSISLNIFELTKLFKKDVTNKIAPKRDYILLVGASIGFLLSIFIILFRQEKKKKK